MSSMFMIGDFKFWRTRTKDNANAGCPNIKTQKALKKKLRDQFLPTNIAGWQEMLCKS